MNFLADKDIVEKYLPSTKKFLGKVTTIKRARHFKNYSGRESRNGDTKIKTYSKSK